MSQENPGSGSGAEPGGHEPDAATAATLLGGVRRLRRQARSVRHAYWFPLVLFGLLTGASVPFYFQPVTSIAARPWLIRLARPRLPESGGFVPAGWHGFLVIYWLAAIAAGLAATYL